MEILIVGGTGRLGSGVARVLRDRGHAVRAASRSSPECRVDLTTGEGLEAALRGVEAVVDASNGPPSRERASAVLVGGTRRLLAAEAQAGVRHHLAVSIVGIDDVPLPYYRVKLEQERLVTQGPIPWTIVRATQFHALLDQVLAAAARRHVSLRARARFQTVADAEVAEVVAGAAVGQPRHGRIEVAGPEVHTLAELSRIRRRVTGERGLPLPVPIPGRLGRALRAGRLTAAERDVTAATTYEKWLAHADA